MHRSSTASAARKASGTLRRLFAESSSVRSNHCAPEVMAVFCMSAIIYLEREAIRSLLMGLRLYAMADEPI